ALAQEENTITTRFGALSISDAGKLLFKGKPLDPRFEVEAGLSLSELNQIRDTDVVLVTEGDGTACPALYYFVIVKKSGAKITHAFGTCSDLIKIKRTGDTISVSMPGFEGDFASKRAQRRAALKKHVYIYRAGVVTENGKPVK
ncbi:MAG TPA: hypothetical protein VN920_15035, partial [Pyrinomonadaceae bacterium]|nr:hypothetical protein [Pyrinomonadaceae bacterium]